jgi:hypothetical protein
MYKEKLCTATSLLQLHITNFLWYLVSLDGPGIETRWGRDFPHLCGLALGPTQPPVQRVPGLSRGYKAAGA